MAVVSYNCRLLQMVRASAARPSWAKASYECVAIRPRTSVMSQPASGSRVRYASSAESSIVAGFSCRSSQPTTPSLPASVSASGVGPKVARRSRWAIGSARTRPVTVVDSAAWAAVVGIPRPAAVAARAVAAPRTVRRVGLRVVVMPARSARRPGRIAVSTRGNRPAIRAHPFRRGPRKTYARVVDQVESVRTPASWVVVGLDNGGTCNNATVLDATGQYLVDHLVENPSLVTEGPEVAVEQLAEAFTAILSMTSTPLTLVRAVGWTRPARPAPTA